MGADISRRRVQLVNRLSQATNLHAHGLHVSPEGIGDNIFGQVGAGETARYEYTIPDDHPTGTFWYHPHLHGSVADQVFAGLYGTIVVTGPAEPPVTRERVLVISDITLAGNGNIAQVSFPQSPGPSNATSRPRLHDQVALAPGHRQRLADGPSVPSARLAADAGGRRPGRGPNRSIRLARHRHRPGPGTGARAHPDRRLRWEGRLPLPHP